MDVPFLPRSHDDDARSARSSSLSSFYRLSVALGLLIGFFVECSALAAHVLYQQQKQIRYQERQEEEEAPPLVPSLTYILATSFVWALLTSLFPCMALVMLRNMLQATVRLVYPGGDSSNNNKENTSRNTVLVRNLIWQLECRFGMGSFAGVAGATLVMDYLLPTSNATQSLHCKMILLLTMVLILALMIMAWKTAQASPYKHQQPQASQQQQQQHSVEKSFEYKRAMDSVDPEA
jgi:hypothetical protein